MNACSDSHHQRVGEGQESCELMLRLHSCFQIKAKNYDKVEKVSATTHEPNLLVGLAHIVFGFQTPLKGGPVYRNSHWKAGKVSFSEMTPTRHLRETLNDHLPTKVSASMLAPFLSPCAS